MRKVIVSEFVSLDGVMEDHQSWTFRFGSEEQERFKSANSSRATPSCWGGRPTKSSRRPGPT
jgi:hypothetical protein